ncbi:DEAD-box ATP-dependent RNA helicase 42-like [Schistocerca americana]|uniref:DEAD-box ATP-dependent RNA helicase 42-like n=1 Tax=Schistocerca americana TaxID=7009 RepID=UPI001F4F2A36|nr:DEAD-box ATP-dependent RNA helicase 42-like [Schistocerca americana]
MADDKGKPTNSVDDGDDTVVKSYPLRSRTGTGRPDSRMERTADDDGVRDVSSQQSSSQQAGENSMVEMMRIFFQEREQEKLEREAYKLLEQRDREHEKLEREAYKLQKQRDREQEKREREAYKLQKQRDRQEREQKEREKERETERKWFDLNTMIGTMKNRLDNIDANLEARIRTVTVEYISELSSKVNERIEGILQKVDACESTVGNVHKDIKVQIESCQAVTTEVSKKSAEVGTKVNKLADNVVILQGQVNDLTQALSEINIEKRICRMGRD